MTYWRWIRNIAALPQVSYKVTKKNIKKETIYQPVNFDIYT